MNYRHAYHAGNFADVLKHVVLARVIAYLKKKDAAFRVIDTHAGIGAYDLGTAEAKKTGEAQDGIIRVIKTNFAPEVTALLAPYLEVVRPMMAAETPMYPGSPLLARSLLRKQDRLTAIELHPADVERLRARFAGDIQTRVIHLDGWLALGAQVPPKEKRGVVLVDPPFEEGDDFLRLSDGVARACRRWPGGTYLLWFPVKDRAALRRFRERLVGSSLPPTLWIEQSVRNTDGRSLDGSGLAVINPPYTLKSDLQVLLPALTRCLAQDATSSFKCEQIIAEK